MFETIKKIKFQRELDGEQGFTLIELLIVIVVLGILAAIVVFALGGVTSQSAVAACNSDAKTVSIAAQAYNSQTGNTATSANQLVTSGYLKSAPANSAYTISITSGAVTVALAATDPGITAAWTGANEASAGTPGTAAPVVAAPPVPYQYEGNNQFLYATPTADLNANICAGA
jgi:general secretion pathway protein G